MAPTDEIEAGLPAGGPPAKPGEPGRGRPERRALAFVLIAMVVVGALRWRLLDVPLDRDEGEYAHAGALLLEGVPPWAEARNMKLPGIYVAYAAVMGVFGETLRGIHLGLLVANLATMALVFWLGRAVLDDLAAAVAAAVFGALSLTEAVQGLSANAEHFVLLCALPGLLFVLRGNAAQRAAWLVPGGLLLGAALVVKQHGALLAAFGGVLALVGPRPWTARAGLARAGVYSAAVLLPYGVACLWLWSAGVFDAFWFWTFDYARAYVGRVSLGDAPARFSAGALPLLSAGAVAVGLAALGLGRSVSRERGGFLAGLALFSFLAVCPGLYFRGHYFVLSLPALALLAGAGAQALARALARLAGRRVAPALTLALGAVSAAWTLAHDRTPLFRLSPTEVSRAVYGLNPFPESLAVAEFVARHTDPADTVAVIGSEPQIYFYAKRKPAHPFLYTYPLVEPQPFARAMQEELVASVEESRPRALVHVQVETSWRGDPDAPKLLFRWLPRFTAGYRLAFVVEIRGDGTRYHEAEAIGRLAAPPNPGIYVYLRR